MNQLSLSNSIFGAFKIALILLLGFVFIVAKFSVQIDWPNSISNLEKAIYLNRFFADFFICTAVFVLLYGKPLWSKLLAWTLALAITAVFFVQEQSFSVTGGFLPSIALENAQHTDFLDTDQHTLAATFWAIFLVLFFRFIASFTPLEPKFLGRLIVAVLLIIIGSQIKNDKHWLSEETQMERFEFYNSGRPGMRRISPITAFKETVEEFREYLERENWVANASVDLSEAAARFALEYDLPYAEIDSEYPLMRNSTKNTSLEFLPEPAKDEQLNVVIIFAEGISARNMEPYSDYFPGLFANVNEFSKSATVVENYYSHAYATYRGLSGQMCSLYAVGRLLPTTKYNCIGHELGIRGYDTRFMVSQRLEKTDLDDVAKRAGFANVDGAEALGELLELEKGAQSSIVTDQQLFDGLRQRMEHSDRDGDQPFAIGVYNFETHTGVRLIESEVAYSNENVARNNTLDTFHNFDKVFGEFWDYFRQSRFAENTILILTSDHATFPSREYLSIIRGSPGYTNVFADEIPLLIYHPRGRAQAPIDAKAASSVNFPPTLMHLMNIDVGLSSFMGKSIFEQDAKFPMAAARGASVLWTKHEESGRWFRMSKRNRDDLPKIFEPAGGFYDYLEFTESLERSNRIYKTDTQSQ